MTTSALDMAAAGIAALYRKAIHEIRWLDRYFNVKPEDKNAKDDSPQKISRGLIVGTTKVQHGPDKVVTVALAFTRSGLELWKTYPGSGIERACEPLPNDWLRFMKESINTNSESVAKEFVRLMSLWPSNHNENAQEVVKMWLKTAIASAIRDKTIAINALATTLCEIT